MNKQINKQINLYIYIYLFIYIICYFIVQVIFTNISFHVCITGDVQMVAFWVSYTR
jgi:hypothetical protein